MSAFQFNTASIQSYVGDEFRVRTRNGNFQVDIAAMQSKGHGLTFSDKYGLLAQAVERLNAAGYACTVRDIKDGFPGRDGWNNWPHIWVNVPVATGTAVNDIKDLLANERKNTMRDVFKMLQATGSLKANVDVEKILSGSDEPTGESTAEEQEAFDQ
jgi:hypothetical protein